MCPYGWLRQNERTVANLKEELAKAADDLRLYKEKTRNDIEEMRERVSLSTELNKQE